jgi:hypothetical protein
MRATQRKLLATTLIAGLGVTALQAEEQRSAKQVRPSYAGKHAKRGEAPEPERRELPSSLRLAVPRDEVSPAVEAEDRDQGAARTRSGSAEADRSDEIRSRALAAAIWAADEAIDGFGRPRYFEIGFHDGLQDAFRRTRHDRWELEQGRRSGRQDPEAFGLGEEIGMGEARLAATEEARHAVVTQFADLTREPVGMGPPLPPPFTASGFVIAEPELRDVFADLAWRKDRHNRIRDLRLDPWRLYQAGGHGDFYDRGWSTPRFGLDLWRRRQRGTRWLRGLDQHERRLFDDLFDRAFERELTQRFAGVADRAFDRGYNAGWRHGIRVGREWQYRRGYHQGFETAVHETARAAFSGSFRPAWEAAYQDLFREWSTTIKLEARAVRLRDGNDDGIFEPGEEVWAELDLVNIGGGSGRSRATLSGTELVEPDRRVVEVPRRSVVRQLAPLRGVIRPAASGLTDTLVTVSIGDLTETLPLRISHVLRFGRELELIQHDPKRGEAVVAVELSNASRRPVQPSLEAEVRLATLRQPRRDLPQIPGGASHNVLFEILGADPLDLMAGDLVLTVDAWAGGRPQDRLEAHLPDLASDLDDDSLVDYLLWLGRSATADRADVERAHQLMLRRLAADWQAAVREKGNPYKRDLRTGRSTTALGDLVAAVRAQGKRTVYREVFTDLVPRINQLSRSLPGSHPFLRSSMRKLSRRLL